MNILITGSTGFIGKRLTRSFATPEHTLYLLVRLASLEKAKAMFSDLPNVIFVIGDVTKNDVVENVKGAQTIMREIECVVHLAATYDLAATLADTYTNNVIGTQNLLYLTQRMKKLKIFHYISTYAVSGIYDGEFTEEQLPTGLNFPDHYSKSKMQAEVLVRNADLKNTQIRIYRPCIIVGDSVTGDMDKVDGPYYFFRLFHFLSKYLKNVPVTPLPLSFHHSTLMPLMPVDILVTWLTKMISHPTEQKLRSYHLVPEEKIFLSDLIHETAKHFDLNFKLQRIPFPKIYSKILPYLKIPAEVGPYLQSQARYSTTNVKTDFPTLKSPPYKSYLHTLIKKYKSTNS